jgi:cytochrome c oxidase cbb3-type subunit 3
MPPFGRDNILNAGQVNDVSEYVISISAARARLHPNAAAVLRGASIFQQNCAVCHGPTGAGDRTIGAPSLNDDVWLYGGSRAEIRKQVQEGRNGVMPTWEARFDSGTLRALAVYVHEMGGGEPEPVAPPTTTPASTPSVVTPPPSNPSAP